MYSWGLPVHQLSPPPVYYSCPRSDWQSRVVDQIQLQRSRSSAGCRSLRAATSRAGGNEGVVPLIEGCSVRIGRQTAPKRVWQSQSGRRRYRNRAAVCISRLDRGALAAQLPPPHGVGTWRDLDQNAAV